MRLHAYHSRVLMSDDRRSHTSYTGMINHTLSSQLCKKECGGFMRNLMSLEKSVKF